MLEDPKTFHDAAERVCVDALKILDTKRSLRGTANITEQGFPGVIDRMILDKGARLRRAAGDSLLRRLLTERGINPAAIPGLAETTTTGESVEDDLLDVLNYAIIATCLRRGWWQLP